MLEPPGGYDQGRRHERKTVDELYSDALDHTETQSHRI